MSVLRPLRLVFSLVLTSSLLFSQATPQKAAPKAAAKKPAATAKSGPAKGALAKKETPQISEKNVRAHIGFLASDALMGRGSATPYEGIAAEYLASQFEQYGLEPGAKKADGTAGFIQEVPISEKAFAAAPLLKVGDTTFTHGKEMAIALINQAHFSGPLQKWKKGDTVQKGAVVYIHVTEDKDSAPVRTQVRQPLQQGAAAVIVADAAQMRQRFAAAARSLPEIPAEIGPQKSQAALNNLAIIVLSPEATAKFDSLADGATVEFNGELKPAETQMTRNVIGVLPGSDPKQKDEVILLSAHFDHVGTDPNRKGDQIFNGADDDASGTTAVLEMARVLASGPRPKRTVYFVLFGSEEKGGWGATYFLDNPPIPLNSIVANLEFEMIGRPDAAVKADELWLTGYERTNLGPEMAKLGAKIVADPHPDQQFFSRSDNYALARRGVVAQTVSSFGLHSDYHQPSDEAKTIDYTHMTHAIQSMVEPVLWLVNSTFKPEWLPNMKP